MAEPKWTTEQQQCIDSRGGSLLVSAAAGSGKTAVLVERIVQRVLGNGEETPVDVDRLMVVTFTRAAAAEMKQRLSVALTEAVAATPDNARLRRQLLLLPTARISTIDSFWASLVRDHATELGLSPDFKVLDDYDHVPLWQAALTEVMERRYAEKDAEFLHLADSFNNSTDDGNLKSVVCQLDNFLQSIAYPDEWIDTQLAKWDGGIPGAIETFARTPIQDLLEESEAVSDDLRAHPAADKMCRGTMDSDSRQIREMRDIFCADGVTAPDIRQTAQSTRPQALPRGRAPQDPDEADAVKRFKAFHNRFKKELESWQTYLIPDEIVCGEMSRLLRALYDLLLEIQQAYGKKKEARQALDFVDTARLTLRLLIDRRDGMSHPTEAALRLREQFDEIFVDEYQDVNDLQDTLFRALSRQEENFFMVGDVKQSVYGFRNARPDLFLDRLYNYEEYDGESYPAVIRLKKNFRSRPQVTDAANFICKQLFSKEVGGLVYGEEEALVPHREEAEGTLCDPTLLLVDAASKTGETADDTSDHAAEDSVSPAIDEAEATVIAREIRSLMDKGMTIPQKDGPDRPLRYGDCCILLRSFSNYADTYRQVLQKHGIPATAVGAGSLFTATEISLILSLLHAIDNPRRDVPLLAVLLSPLFGFTTDDVALIRAEHRQGRLCVAVRRAAKRDDALGRRCADFLRRMEAYRLLAATVPVHELIRTVYEETDLLRMMAVKPNGAERVANLRLFHEMARGFEENGFRGLSSFLRRMDTLKEIDKTNIAVGEQTDAVRLLTVHKSKGLEFPIVFVAGMATAWGNQSFKSSLFVHADAGIAMKFIDPDTLSQNVALPVKIVQQAILQDERAEGLRLLYVAMTRAREKLYLVTTLKDPQKKLKDLSAVVGEELTLPPDFITKYNGSFSDWVLAAMLRHPDAACLRERAGVPEDFPVLPDTRRWCIRIVDAIAAETAADETADTPEADSALAETLSERFAYTYPYRALQHVPNKIAASDLAHRDRSHAYTATARPAVMNTSGLTAAERGTAIHLFMQYADWEAAAADADGERERLRREGYLTDEQAAVVDLKLLRAFFAGELYARIARADRLWREIPFTVEWPLSELALLTEAGGELPPDGYDETVMIQGIADCVFEENGKLIIVDYKTDRVKDGAELAERYHRQLQLYARALEPALGLPVGECLLYSFALGETVRVDAC